MFKFGFFWNFLQLKFSFVILRLSLYSQIHRFIHQTILETIWTIVPVIIVLSIAIPSFLLLYAVDISIDASVLAKVIGHQWYWSYEIEVPFFDSMIMKTYKLNFDSYMVNSDELLKGQLRLLEVDNSLILPSRTHIELIVSSEDVLHSFSLPSAGIKVDAIPGRINHTTAFIERSCILYGQCSELCGANHGFMPIKVMVMPYDFYFFSLYKLVK